ncbi:hypothetical protein TIFTF001_045882 [Ficus carica]|uniref:Uncharacterized protein n=1 Tax=Ficus carica TaxID=3494 RepID=A0AA87YWN1_FICCA|nr:hypothetical protein TIFTF001_045882 [Ficus carica]
MVTDLLMEPSDRDRIAHNPRQCCHAVFANHRACLLLRDLETVALSEISSRNFRMVWCRSS